jgi:predicted transcriptional regulator
VRNLSELQLTPNNGNFDLFFWTLANKTCRKIIKLLILFKKLNISSLAKQLDQTEANVSFQVKKLEKAGLLKVNYQTGKHGINKNISLAYSHISIFFTEELKNRKV